MANPKNVITFTIDHLDPMGQGVAKKEGEVYFIAKTLPQEKGEGLVVKSSKGVNFVTLQKLTSRSSLRKEPECPHYQECAGCHYLHTDYSEEKTFKRQSYRNIFKKLMRNECELDEIWSDTRLGYRNRIQLHYDLKMKKLGFLKAKSRQILEVPYCKLPDQKIQEKMQKLYHDQAWLKEASSQKTSGHFEIYQKENGVEVNWNAPYAFGGFSQVNQAVNQKMKDYLKELLFSYEFKSLCDLFGGSGNLSENLMQKDSSRVVVDVYQKQMHENFFSLDLFDENALYVFKKKYPQNFDLLLVDPPRSGFKTLYQWADSLKPKYLVYISCHPQTQARDLMALSGYKIKKFCLIDLFPATFHFESLIFLERN